MINKNGGPVFPQRDKVQVISDDGASWMAVDSPGMSLRDYFAAKAMQALTPICTQDTLARGRPYEEYIAEKSYLMADAMLAERERDE